MISVVLSCKCIRLVRTSFGAYIKQTSPFWKLSLSWRPAANWRTWSLKSPYVSFSPVSSSMNSGRLSGILKRFWNKNSMTLHCGSSTVWNGDVKIIFWLLGKWKGKLHGGSSSFKSLTFSGEAGVTGLAGKVLWDWWMYVWQLKELWEFSQWKLNISSKKPGRQFSTKSVASCLQWPQCVGIPAESG